MNRKKIHYNRHARPFSSVHKIFKFEKSGCFNLTGGDQDQTWWRSLKAPFNFINYRYAPLTTPGSRLLLKPVPAGNSSQVGFSELYARTDISNWAKFAAPFMQLNTGDHCGNYLDSFPMGCKSWKGPYSITANFADVDSMLLTLHGRRSCFVSQVPSGFVMKDGIILESGGRVAALVPRNLKFDLCGERLAANVAGQGKIGVAMDVSPDRAYEKATEILRYEEEDLRKAGLSVWEKIISNAPAPGATDEITRRKYVESWWTLLNNLVSPFGMTTRYGIHPGEKHMAVWDWDCACYAIGMSNLDLFLAKELVLLILDHQLENGRFPDTVADWRCNYRATKPPIIHIAAWIIYQKSRDVNFLKEIYGKLLLNVNWWLGERAGRDGLPLYAHSHDSGADNSPRFDLGVPVQCADLAAFLVNALGMLSFYAKVLGRNRESQAHVKRARALKAKVIKTNYDRGKQIFFDRYRGKKIELTLAFNLLPLCLLENKEAKTAFDRHFFGPSLNTPFPITTGMRDHYSYEPHDKRGCIRPLVNLLLSYQFSQNDLLLEEMKRLAARTMAMICRNRCLRLRYHPETGEGMDACLSSWTAATFIEFLLGGPWQKALRWPRV